MAGKTAQPVTQVILIRCKFSFDIHISGEHNDMFQEMNMPLLPLSAVSGNGVNPLSPV